MKKYRIASLMLILLILTVYTVPSAYSVEKGTVYSEIITSVQKDDSISIPIKIKNAEALMGFKLSFTPLGDELHVSDVKCGELTENGFLNHNADINESTFEVVWSGTEAIGENGVICILNAECVEDFKDFSLQMTYSQPDTFDENFNDIELLCETVTIKGTLAEESSGYNGIAQEIVKSDNEESIISSIDSVLEKLDCRTPNEITEDDLEEFIDDISASVSGFSTATQGLSDKEKLDVVKEIYNIIYEQETTTSSVSSTNDTLNFKPSDNNFVIVIVAIIIVVIVLVAILLIRRRKKYEKSNS